MDIVHYTRIPGISTRYQAAMEATRKAAFQATQTGRPTIVRNIDTNYGNFTPFRVANVIAFQTGAWCDRKGVWRKALGASKTLAWLFTATLRLRRLV